VFTICVSQGVAGMAKDSSWRKLCDERVIDYFQS